MRANAMAIAAAVAFASASATADVEWVRRVDHRARTRNDTNDT